MKLFYVNNGKEEFIQSVQNENEAMNEIKKFWQKNGYDIPYFRLWQDKDRLKIDFSSHNKFYHLYEDDKAPIVKKPVEITFAIRENDSSVGVSKDRDLTKEELNLLLITVLNIVDDAGFNPVKATEKALTTMLLNKLTD